MKIHAPGSVVLGNSTVFLTRGGRRSGLCMALVTVGGGMPWIRQVAFDERYVGLKPL